MDEVLAHYDRIGERMSALSDEIAEHFLALDRNAALQVASEAPATASPASASRGSSR